MKIVNKKIIIELDRIEAIAIVDKLNELSDEVVINHSLDDLRCLLQEELNGGDS